MEFNACVNECKEVINFYTRTYSYLGEDMKDDIRQECLMGIDRASKSYDSSLGSFKNYAAGWIRNYVYDYVSSMRGPVNLSRAASSSLRRVRRALEECPNATLSELSALTGLSEEVCLRYLTGFTSVSLDKKIGDNDSPTLLEAIADDSAELKHKREVNESLILALDNYLSLDEKELLFSFYGINGPKLSQKELGMRLGISHQAVSKRVNKIIERLQKDMASLGSLYLFYRLKNIFNFF